MARFITGKNTQVFLANQFYGGFATDGNPEHGAVWTAGSNIVTVKGIYPADNNTVNDTTMLLAVGSRAYGDGLTNNGQDTPVYVTKIVGNTVFLSMPADTDAVGYLYTQNYNFIPGSLSGQSTNLSPFFNDAGISKSTAAEEVTTFHRGDAKAYITGIRDGSITISGFYDGSLDGVEAALQAAAFTSSAKSNDPFYGVVKTQGQSLPQGIVVFPDGGDAGGAATCYMAKGIVTKADLKSPVSGVVAIDSEIQSTHGVWRGKGQVASFAYGSGTPDAFGRVTLYTNTVDNGADSSSGGLAIVGIIESAGGYFTDTDGHYGSTGIQYPPVDLQVQASADGATWVGLTNLWSDQAGQIVDLTGTIYRYTRLSVALFPSDTPNPPSSATVYYGLARY